MSTSIKTENPPNELQWDFYRPASSEHSQVIHYYDNWAQEIYPTPLGLQTTVGKVDKGHWSEVTMSDIKVINNSYYSQMRSDHPSNGGLYMSAIQNGRLEFLRYQYMVDISPILDSWDQQYKENSTISDLGITLKNIGIAAFMGDMSVFLPGAKIDFSVMLGRNELQMGVYWLDEIDFDQHSESVSISSRNYSGQWLNDQTMDNMLASPLKGPAKSVIRILLEHAGITDYIIQPTLDTEVSVEHKSEDSILSVINSVADLLSSETVSLCPQLLEHTSGRFLFGRRNWLDQYMCNNAYEFQDGKDLFSRNTTKCLDGAYTQLRVTGEIAGTDPVKNHPPVVVPISNFQSWYLKPRKTKHIKAPTPMTTAEFSDFVKAQKQVYQYVGVSEDFTGPYRPQLYIGDVAKIVHDEGLTKINLGVINQITHSFSVDDGFKTDFCVDSGGISTDGDNYVVYTSTGRNDGKNRKMSIIDVMRIMSK